MNPTGVRCRSWRDRATGCPRIASSRCWSRARVDYAIFMLDPHGRVVTWNAGAEAIKGYTRTEIIGQHFSVFYTEEDVARDHPAEELRHRRPRRALRGGGLARPQGRLALLGQRRHHRAARRGRASSSASARSPATSPCAGSRRSRCAPGRCELEAGQPAARRVPPARRRACATTRSSCSTRPATSSPGTRARGTSRATTPEEIIGRHFSVFYTAEDRARRPPGARARGRRPRGPLRGGGLARPQGRHALLGAA